MKSWNFYLLCYILSLASTDDCSFLRNKNDWLIDWLIDNLFSQILFNENHVLHQLLPPARNILYSLSPMALLSANCLSRIQSWGKTSLLECYTSRNSLPLSKNSILEFNRTAWCTMNYCDLKKCYDFNKCIFCIGIFFVNQLHLPIGEVKLTYLLCL